MSESGVAGLRLMIDDALAVLRTLDDDEWNAESGCPGWTVKDLVNHLVATFAVVIDPTNALDGITPEVELEVINDMMVQAGADMAPEEVMAEYERLAPEALAAVAAVQGPELAGVEALLGDLGSYAVHWFANALCFDHLCHLTADVLAPRGPVKRDPIEVDEARLSPAMDWMVAGIPQMSGPGLAEALTTPVDVEFTGTGGKRFQLQPSGGTIVTVAQDSTGGAATISSPAIDAMTWLTGRTDRTPVTTVTGDEALGTAVLKILRAV